MKIAMNRRSLFLGLAATLLSPSFALAAKKKKRAPYQGAEWVDFDTPEKPGTIIINTDRRVLYHVQGDGVAVRYGVAVGKAGFEWSGIAKVGKMVAWPRWTPPASMIERRPELAVWANGMPGGL
jgi:lipoprotein-anchoring transpeptidase ErfK/SrfK